MNVFWIGIVVVVGGVSAIASGLFAFHCGYIYGRYGISAHEYYKRRRQAGSPGSAND